MGQDALVYRDAAGVRRVVSAASPLPVGTASVGTPVASVPGTALNNVMLGPLDTTGISLLAFQVGGTFVGSITPQFSFDGGTTWNTGTAYTQGGVPTSGITGQGVFVLQTVAPLTRLIVSAYTSGTMLVLGALAYADGEVAPSSVVVSVLPVPPAIQGEVTESTTVLAASATYTGATRDSGITVATRSTRIRPMVQHTAGLTPGLLILQESIDGASWRETRRQPIPSDGGMHTFDWSLRMRYHRILFVNGAATQTTFLLHTIRANAEGSTTDVAQALSFPLVAGALAASAVFTQVLDLGTNHRWELARLIAAGDAASGPVTIQQSQDGTTWYTAPAAEVGAHAAGGSVALESKIVVRFIRASYTNGAAAQTQLRLSLALISL